jgi:predicted transposase/invertase (TIGR01784 family)
MGVNVKYKASLFSFLFSEPDLLRELYCAIAGITLPSNVPVVINTLQDVLFMGRINDISFEMGGKVVVLFEHQSTINPNMALRLLIYITLVYEKLIGDRNIYATRPIVIPRPEFFVLYNGTAPFPDKKTIKLSDLFESALLPGVSDKESPALDLEVKVININQGRNREIAERCRKLWEYSAFIEKVREFEKEKGKLEEGFKEAVKYCRKHDILKELLEKNATEVMNMLMTEWNWDDALAFRYEEGIEEGMEKGMEAEREQVARNALAQGVSPELIHTITGLDIEAINSIQLSL